MMEEIEYLEEYEDIILPNAAKRRRLSEERKSLDSLEVLYKDLIGDSPTPATETVIDSMFIGNLVESTDDTSPLVMVDVNLASNSYEIPNTISAPTTYNNATTVTDQLQQSAYKSSTTSLLNHTQDKSFSTYSVQRPQLKSVATVKPTLQRHNNPTKQNVYNNIPPLKNSTGDQTLQPTSIASQANGKMTHGSQSSTNHNKLGSKQIKSTNGLRIDPLSLDEQDAFLDFDVDRPGSVDGLDFDSDFDTGLLSDMDSVDFSDNFSDNFDLDSELSSDGSDIKKLFKKRKVQQEGFGKPKQTAKAEQKNGQTNLKKGKSTPQLKTGADDPAASKKLSPESNLSSSLAKPTITSAIRTPVEKKDGSISLVASKVKRLVPSEELSKLIAQELQKTSEDKVASSTPVAFNSKKTAVLEHCKRMITQLENELNKSSGKSTQNLNTSAEKSRILESQRSPDVTIKKPIGEQKRPTEPVNQKVTTPQSKKPLLKFGTSYLKSIKPPTCTKEKTLKTKLTSDQPKTLSAKKLLEKEVKSPATKGKTPEPNTSTSFKESKTIFSVGSSSLKPTTPTLPSSARGQTSNKTYLKRKESRESEFSEKSVVVHSFKPQKRNLESVIENGHVQNENNVTDNKPSYKVNGSTLQLMEDKTKDSQSSKENFLSMQSQQTKSDPKKSQPLPTKFTMRCLRIRLNRNTVPQFIKCAKYCPKLKRFTAVKGLKKDSAIPSAQKTLSLSTEELAPSTERKIGTKPNKASLEKASVNLSDQVIVKPSSNASPGKRKRNKFKLSSRPKVLRRSNKPLSSIIEPHQNIVERQKSTTVTDEPCPKAKESQNDQSVLETTPVPNKPCEEAVLTTETSPAASVGRSFSNLDGMETTTIKPRAGRKKRFRNLSSSSIDMDKESSVHDSAPVNENIGQQVHETTPQLREEPTEAANECASSEAAAPVSVYTAEQDVNQHFEPVEPKTEIFNDTFIYQFPPKNDTTLTSESGATEQDLTKRTAYELPSYIVMKTKIVTRDELKSNTNQVPSVVRQKINQLAQQRQTIPVFKTETPEFEETEVERPEFRYVCHEINTLLDRNANYLKFASGSERQTRMSQVLADSSLTVEDAQCTLKFLQSYLGLQVKDSPTSRMKNQQFIPIYDSQRKVIGYRKRTLNSKNSSSANEHRQLVPNRISVLSSSTSSPATVETSDSLTASEMSSIEKTIVEFTTKKEPLTVDTGDEEMIVPDIAPAISPCIKSETIEV